MPNSNLTGKKNLHKSAQKQNNVRPSNANSIGNSENNCTGSYAMGTRSRKRKRCEAAKFPDSDFESELEDCNLEDALAIEKKLRKVAEKNSLSDEEMRKLLQTFVKNEHILALVTLQAEDEVAKEKKEAEKKMSVIITDTPNVVKLTRAKAKELNTSPSIVVPPISTLPIPKSDIASLIHETLHSDEDDEEYTFKDEDFHSDDDPNTTASDLDSNPRTPQTPLTTTEYDNSPIKYTEDGCFKIPLDKKGVEEDLKIYARTRSKLCLQETTIEDIEANFVPPDVEQIELQDLDYTATDDDWMQFLNEFSKPLNSNVVADEDDPINDPEYVAAEKEPVDAEELRNVNISKKELTDLVAELFEGLIHDNVSIEHIELETPQKFVTNSINNNILNEDTLNTPQHSAEKIEKSPEKTDIEIGVQQNVSRQITFELVPTVNNNDLVASNDRPKILSNIPINNSTADAHDSVSIQQSSFMFSTNYSPMEANNNCYENTIASTIMPVPASSSGSAEVTPFSSALQPALSVPPVAEVSSPINVGQIIQLPIANNSSKIHSASNTVTVPYSAVTVQPDLIAVPVPGQPNCYQIAKVIASNNNLNSNVLLEVGPSATKENETPAYKSSDTRYSQPYDANHTWEYISIKRHISTEHRAEFENLRNLEPYSAPVDPLFHCTANGFTPFQHEILQQQLRIHVQYLTQTFLQTYCHPEFWKLSSKPKEMLLELHEKAKIDASFRVWNLNSALELMNQWEKDMSVDSEENKEMMNFIHREIDRTTRHTRQVQRFAPKLMDFMLESNVFVYPQYLPRIPFVPKVIPYEIFAPSESYLIAIGLTKHYKYCVANKPKVQGKHEPFDVALRLASKDTVHGKSKRRILWQIQRLQKQEGYNPIKYYFDHECAPPTFHKLITFQNNTVPKLCERVSELPPGWQKYIHEKNSGKDVNNPNRRRNPGEIIYVRSDSKTTTKPSRPKASEKAKKSYLEFVREAVGEDILLPENFAEAKEPTEGATPGPLYKKNTSTSTKISPHNSQKANSKNLPSSLTINVNYVFGANFPCSSNTPSLISRSTVTSHNLGEISYNQEVNANPSPNKGFNNFSQPQIEKNFFQTSQNSLATSFSEACWGQLPGSTPLVQRNTTKEGKTIDGLNKTPENIPIINYEFDLASQTLQPVNQTDNSSRENSIQRKLTDYYILEDKSSSNNWVDEEHVKSIKNSSKVKKVRTRPRRLFRSFTCLTVEKAKRKFAIQYRKRKQLRKLCAHLLLLNQTNLDKLRKKFIDVPLIQNIFIKIKALDLYTSLLRDLKMFCRTAVGNTAGGSATGSFKRSRNEQGNDNENNNPTRTKKAHRQEESLRQMLMPENSEEANRKDAIFAYNFYEKVEEILAASKKPEDCKKFNAILKNFDPSKDKVADLYRKMESLFLPDHPELAQVFLSFLLPSEASDIGKFFEHFMITNATTFVNKLNIYFSKQPAQIRKIYNCLNELAEDPKTDMKQVETKMLPLLKGNQFLIDWFMQQFPEATPPERILPTAESINLKEVNNTQNGEYMEHIVDTVESSSQDQQGCQLRYANGRIFYGSKIVLPAKLSFMATKLNCCPLEDVGNSDILPSTNGCIHGIREQGEKRLANATAVENAISVTNDCTSDDNEKSEEEDTSKALIIDTTVEEDSCSSIETCDEATLKAHTLRLNPSYYSSSIFNNPITSTPNPNNAFQTHPHARKSSLNFCDDAAGKISPRKHGLDIRSLGISPLNNQSIGNNSVVADMQIRDKRKSPNKKLKSPVANVKTRVPSVQPMVVIHEQSPTLACARKLKSFISESSNEIDDEDHKLSISIVARTKSSLNTDCVNGASHSNQLDTNRDENMSSQGAEVIVTKVENSDDLEFLSENSENTVLHLPQSPYPVDVATTNEGDNNSSSDKINQSMISSFDKNPRIVTQFDSDEDCKLDVVACLVGSEETSSLQQTSKAGPSLIRTVPDLTKKSQAWTRDEDKVILIEMKLGSHNRQSLYARIETKLRDRTLNEIIERHQFLIDFLAKLQGKS